VPGAGAASAKAEAPRIDKSVPTSILGVLYSSTMIVQSSKMFLLSDRLILLLWLPLIYLRYVLQCNMRIDTATTIVNGTQ